MSFFRSYHEINPFETAGAAAAYAAQRRQPNRFERNRTKPAGITLETKVNKVLYWTDTVAPKANGNTLKAVFGKINAWRLARAYRRDLARLAETSPHLLADIGLDPSSVAVDTVRQDVLA
jgi:uncharacterized protein YjiS (DUF1127 family)